MDDIGRFVARPSMRNRREIGRIGFGEDPILGCHSCSRPDRLGAGERHNSRKGQVKTELERRTRHRLVTRKTVEDAAQLVPVGRAQDVERLVGRLTGMNDHRKSQLECEFHLRTKDRSLHVARREVVVIIEADLADRARMLLLRLLPHGQTRLLDAPREVTSLMWMDADGESHIWPDLTHPPGPPGLHPIAGRQDAERARQARVAGPCHDGLEIGGELLTRQIVAGIAKAYTPDQLVGKRIVIVVNLKPAKLRGIESQGMLLAADVGGRPIVATFDEPPEPGTRVR